MNPDQFEKDKRETFAVLEGLKMRRQGRRLDALEPPGPHKTSEKAPSGDDLVSGVRSELLAAQKRIAALEEALNVILTRYAIIYKGPQPEWILNAKKLMEKVGSESESS